MTGERYNLLFRNMILCGYACGVTKPHETICNYDHGMSIFNDEKEHDEFLNKAVVDIYSAIQCKTLTFEEANLLYDKDLNWIKHARFK